MSFISDLVGGSAAKPIDAIGNVFNQLFTSDEERLTAEAVLAKIRQYPQVLQAEINKLQIQTNQKEAAHKSIFVAGWRPYIGWVGGTALGFNCIVLPLLAFIFGRPAPTLPTAQLLELILLLLGAQGVRSYDKKHGLTK